MEALEATRAIALTIAAVGAAVGVLGGIGVAFHKLFLWIDARRHREERIDELVALVPVITGVEGAIRDIAQELRVAREQRDRLASTLHEHIDWSEQTEEAYRNEQDRMRVRVAAIEVEIGHIKQQLGEGL